jgi:hypothetical protein
VTPEQNDLVLRLLSEHIRVMRNQVRTQEALSQPVPKGQWRWADLKSPYTMKSEDELAQDRERAKARLAEAVAELRLTEDAWRTLQLEEGRTP